MDKAAGLKKKFRPGVVRVEQKLWSDWTSKKLLWCNRTSDYKDCDLIYSFVLIISIIDISINRTLKCQIQYHPYCSHRTTAIS